MTVQARSAAALAAAAVAAGWLVAGLAPDAHAAPPGDARPPLELSSFPRTSLTITTHARQRHTFDVWVADTPERAEQGLMYVRDLPANRGMVFVFPEPRVEMMWMKNTYIELDMLFIDAGGRVVKIIARATPLSLATLSSDVPVTSVLELKGGEAARLGLANGDVVSWKMPGG